MVSPVSLGHIVIYFTISLIEEVRILFKRKILLYGNHNTYPYIRKTGCNCRPSNAASTVSANRSIWATNEFGLF